jgi:hypothetical protein
MQHNLYFTQTIPASLHQNQVATTTYASGTDSPNYSEISPRNEATALSRGGTNDRGIKLILSLKFEYKL